MSEIAIANWNTLEPGKPAYALVGNVDLVVAFAGRMNKKLLSYMAVANTVAHYWPTVILMATT
ncbi:MAG: hypothetical protein R3E93_01060 [Thiothrix sp.]